MQSKADILETKKQESGIDILKWVLSTAIMCGGLFGYHYYEQYPAVYRAIALIPVAMVSIVIAGKTLHGAAFLQLLREALVEVRRVVWPTQQETTQTTLIVVGVVFVMALVLWGLDASFGKLMSLIIG